MGYFVYIIYSSRLARFYTGTTDDHIRRISEHNSGRFEDSFTAKGIPWELFLLIDELTSDQAFKIEKHIKSMKSSTYIRNLKSYPELVEKLKARYKPR